MPGYSFTSLDPGKPWWCIRLAENNDDFGSGNKIKPYQFEPVNARGFSDSEDDSSESETTGKLHWVLGNDRLVRVRKIQYVTMSSGIKCHCCREMKGLQEHLTGDSNEDNLHCVHW